MELARAGRSLVLEESGGHQRGHQVGLARRRGCDRLGILTVLGRAHPGLSAGVAGGGVGELLARARQQLRDADGGVAAQPFDVVGAEVEELGELGALVLVVERPALGEPPHPGNLGAGGGQGLRGEVDDVAVGAPRGQRQHRHGLEVPVEQALRERRGEPVVSILEALDLAPELLVAVARLVDLRLHAVELRLQGVDRDPVEEGRPQREADAEREEDRGDADDVVAEVDHRGSNPRR